VVEAQPVPHPDVRAVLPREREAFLALLAGLHPDEWEAPTECPAWTVKGIALHILGDDLSLLARQRDRATPSLSSYAEDHPGLDFRGLLDGFNEQWVATARFLSPALVVELLRVTGDWTATFYGEVDPDSPGEPVAFFASPGPAPYWQSVAREYVERWAHHQQVRRAVRRPDLGDEFLVPALDVIARGLAAHLPDLGAAKGTLVALTVPGAGTWALRRVSAGWATVSASGDSREPDAALRVDRALAAPVFSRALPLAEASAAITVAGDPSLGEAVRQVVARMAAR
jgi:uncharacterized protein (TIGR03083 family)